MLSDTTCWYLIKLRTMGKNRFRIFFPHGPRDLSTKSLKSGRNRGFDPSLKKLSIESLLTRCVSEPTLKVGWKFWDTLFAPLKLWEKNGIKNRICTWDRCPKSHIGLCRASFNLPILVGQAGKPVMNSMTPFFVYDNLSIKKTWVAFMLILINSWFGTKPTVSSTLRYNCSSSGKILRHN